MMKDHVTKARLLLLRTRLHTIAISISILWAAAGGLAISGGFRRGGVCASGRRRPAQSSCQIALRCWRVLQQQKRLDGDDQNPQQAIRLVPKSIPFPFPGYRAYAELWSHPTAHNGRCERVFALEIEQLTQTLSASLRI
jgi:hypothetical protein